MNKTKTNTTPHPTDADNIHVSDEMIDSLARCALPLIQAYYKSEEGQREFAEWKAKKKKEEPCR